VYVIITDFSTGKIRILSTCIYMYRQGYHIIIILILQQNFIA